MDPAGGRPQQIARRRAVRISWPRSWVECERETLHLDENLFWISPFAPDVIAAGKKRPAFGTSIELGRSTLLARWPCTSQIATGEPGPDFFEIILTAQLFIAFSCLTQIIAFGGTEGTGEASGRIDSCLPNSSRNQARSHTTVASHLTGRSAAIHHQLSRFSPKLFRNFPLDAPCHHALQHTTVHMKSVP